MVCLGVEEGVSWSTRRSCARALEYDADGVPWSRGRMVLLGVKAGTVCLRVEGVGGYLIE